MTDTQVCERCEELEETLQRIVNWADAYPAHIFHEPTNKEYQRAAKLLIAGGMTLDAFSASMGRHCLKGVGEIARAALARRHATVAERIDHVARDLAHELFSRDCWAFTGEGMKPHSADCEAAYQRISATLTSYAKGLHQP